MSDTGDFDEQASRRKYTAPYTPHHPVPTVQRYHERQEHERSTEAEAEVEDDEDESKAQKALGTVKKMLGREDNSGGPSSGQKQPYKSENRNEAGPTDNAGAEEQEQKGGQPNGTKEGGDGKGQSTTESAASQLDPRQKRKNMKHMKRDEGEREVTDPVTHLPIMISDSTNKTLKKIPQNLPAAGSEPRSATGLQGANKSKSQLDLERKEELDEHKGMEKLFPPPEFDAAQAELLRTYQLALTVGLVSVLAVSALILVASQWLFGRRDHRAGDHKTPWFDFLASTIALLTACSVCGGGVVWFIREWLGSKVRAIWEDNVWDAARHQEQDQVQSPTPESVQWLNSLLASVWPLINPDLFTSLADTLEDVMQASLPKAVRMISVEDLGQGSESIRILGIRWLPTGAAARSVSVDGKLKSPKSQETSDRTQQGEGQVEQGNKDDESNSEQKGGKKNDKSHEQEEESVAEGMEAEQGDFVNIEVAFAYRARSSGKSLKTKAKNAHLYLAFYLYAGLKMPVWVEMRGIVGTMRMRLQLIPDPPFFALATITFLGQPKADLSCVPLSKHSLNIMDVPLISTFVQSSIDAALAEYVAPKSLTLDLKDMLVGDDFKKNTTARGVIVVKIKRALEFKEGDGNLGKFKKGSSDPYVTTGWAKFGKPVSSTRIIIDEMKPVWEEMTTVLVGPEELNAEERLRLQLWDSDRTTADDDLGRVEVDLKDLMKNPKSKGKMWDRHDNFMGSEADEKMPGFLEWTVGYFPKTRITSEQLAKQSEEPDIKSVDQLKQKVSEKAEGKLREATSHDESKEIEQQKVQDLKEREDKLIISSPPSNDYPSGIFSIQIHQITGLEFEQIRKNRTKKEEEKHDSEMEGSEDLPSSYCTVILNHQMIFKTRTKPKNAKPFFNAGTERFIRDWRTTEVMLSVRDSRVHENDPLLGIVYLPLAHFLRSRSQINDTFPLVGGIGYGRARISMVFRSVQLQTPRELLGWDYGTLEFTSPIKSPNLPQDIRSLRLKLRTSVARGKMYANNESHNSGSAGEWKPKRDKNICLAVRKRYCTCLVIEFRKNALGPDKTAAFAVLWLKDIPDEEDRTVKLQVWPGSGNLKRAETNCTVDFDAKPIGEIEVPFKFWRGLSGYHQKLASKDKNLKDVMEVLDTANDNKEGEGDGTVDSDTDDSSSDHEEEEDKGGDNQDGEKENKNIGKQEQEDGSRGPMQQVKDYKDHHKQLHRQHRGLMQWKGARTVDWMKTKVDHGKDKVMDTFRHNERDPGVETEV